MTPQLHPTVWKGTLYLALAALGLLPVGARCESITITNTTLAPLVVQMASVISNTVRRDRPYPLYPGQTVKIVLPGNKVVNIYDARIPNRVLYQGRISSSPEDLFFAVLPDPRNVDPRNIPRVSLQITPPPKPSPLPSPPPPGLIITKPR